MENKDGQTKKSGAWLLFSFKGRISRKPYWIFNLFVFLAGIVFSVFTEPAENINEITKSQFMFMLWILWPNLAIQVKRWHDQDRSAWWLLLNLTPALGPYIGFLSMAGPVWALVQNGFMPGTAGPNRYGPDPLEEEEDAHRAES